MTVLKDLVHSLLSELGKISKTEAVAGKVRDAGKAKVMPLCKVSIGFGTGSAGLGGKGLNDKRANFNAGGAGGALTVEPKAFVVVGEDGVPKMLVLHGKKAVVRNGVAIGPERSPLKELAAARVPALVAATLIPSDAPAPAVPAEAHKKSGA